MLRGLYAGAMAALQIPAGRLAERFGGRAVLALGTALSALGYALAGLSGGALGLGAALLLAGAGSSTQHPLASAAVARAYAGAARRHPEALAHPISGLPEIGQLRCASRVNPTCVREPRSALGVYNFTGDLGKAAIPALTSLLLIALTWRQSLWVLALIGLATAVAIALLMPPFGRAPAAEAAPAAEVAPCVHPRGGGRGGFALLFAIG